MIAAIYTRVSTDEQARDGLSLAVQERRCREAAEAHGADTIDAYRDDGYTSRDLDRPALQRLLDRLDRYDRIYVLDQSRWTRDPEHLEQLRRRLLAAGVALVPLSMPLDHESPEGQLMSRVVLATDRFQIDVARAKVVASLRDRAERGFHHGRVPLGYSRPDDRDAPLEIDPTGAATVRRIYRMAAAGETLSAIARALTADEVPSALENTSWRPRNVQVILENPVYRGMISYCDEELPGAHEAIIEDDLWYRVQSILADRQFEQPARRGRLSPLFSCGYCGGSIVTIVRSSPAYTCDNRNRAPHDQRHVPLFKSRQAIWAVLWAWTEHLLSSDVLAAAAARREPAGRTEAEVEEELGALDEEIRYNYEVGRQGGMPPSWVAEANRELLARREHLLASRRARSSNAGASDALEWLSAHADGTVTWMRSQSEARQRMLLELIYTTVHLYRDGMVFEHAVELPDRGVAYPEWRASEQSWGPVSLATWSP